MLIPGSREWRFRRRFESAARAAPQGPLRRYYEAGIASFDTPADVLPLIAIDLETDGLDFGKSAILEAGLVEMETDRIFAGSMHRIRFSPPEALSEDSVIIHQITDDALIDAPDETEALGTVLSLLTGKIPVAHFAEIEAGFLDAAIRRVYGTAFVAPFICTMQLEARWFPRVRAADGLRLSKLRAGYGLPAYHDHDGLIDALACGELLMAQINRRSPQGLTLGDLISR